MSDKRKHLTIGMLIGFLPAVGIAWAFAVTAAEHVVGPHMESARVRVHLMCSWAKVQSENTEAICKATGASCRTMDARVLLQGCEETEK